jgi:hypothetical protein
MNRILVAIAAALLAIASIQTFRLSRANAHADSNAARADSIAAASDSTRAVGEKALNALRALYRDSVRAVERRVLQLQPKKDAADKALERSTAANASLTARIKQLEAVTSGVVTTGDSNERKSDFRVDSAPYHVQASVTLPPTGRGTLALRVALDSAVVSLRLQCGKPVGGYAPATALLVTPIWLSARIDSVRQSPDICNPPPKRHWYDGRFTLGPSANMTFERDGTAHVGLGFSAQIALLRWP